MSKRMLHELGHSLSFGRLSLKGKVLWTMLVSTSDDQGRGTAESDAIKWYVCPNVMEIIPDDVPALLDEMQNQGMLIIYNTERGLVYQMVRWWEYQQHQWARHSKFDPPEGWSDRIRYSNRGDYHETDWHTTGGFTSEPTKKTDGEPPKEPGRKPASKPVDNQVDFQPNLTQPNSTELNVIKNNSISDLFKEMKEYWIELFPEKPKPRLSKTIRAKLFTRSGEQHFMDNWRGAMLRGSKSNYVWKKETTWFYFGWLLKNDENYEMTLNGKYDFKPGTKRDPLPVDRTPRNYTNM